MYAINNFYNRVGDIIESNWSEQTVTWADNIFDRDNDCINSIPGLQVRHSDDNSSSWDEESINIFNESSDMPWLHVCHFGDDSSSIDEESIDSLNKEIVDNFSFNVTQNLIFDISGFILSPEDGNNINEVYNGFDFLQSYQEVIDSMYLENNFILDNVDFSNNYVSFETFQFEQDFFFDYNEQDPVSSTALNPESSPDLNHDPSLVFFDCNEQDPVPSTVLNPEPSPDPSPDPSPIPSSNPIDNIVNGTFKSSVVSIDLNGNLAIEVSLDGELYYDVLSM